MSDQEIIETALRYWANHIETGNIHYSAVEASNSSLRKAVPGLGVCPLVPDQMKLVLRIRGLSEEKWIKQ